MIDFHSLPMVFNLAIFAIAAAAVWWAGTRLALYADAIADLTGLGSAFIGMFMLGGITSLPEIAVTVSASITGNAALAVNNLLGGVAMQVTVIAIGDLALGGHALSFVIGRPRVLLQGVFCSILLAMVVVAISTGDFEIAGMGIWSSAIFVTAIALLWFVAHEKKVESEGWKVTDLPDIGEAIDPEGKPETLSTAIWLTLLVGAIILVAGYVLAVTGEALAAQTGLGTSFIGATLVGLATSLPEISTVLAVVRRRRYMMAFSDIFGTNILDVSFIFLIDLAYAGPPVLNEVGEFSQVAATLGILVTLLYVAGLIERRDDTIGRLGIDSWLVILVYCGGIGILYTLR